MRPEAQLRRHRLTLVARLIKDAIHRNEPRKVTDILVQLEALATNANNSLWRYGGVMGLAAASIALSANIAPYLFHIVPPILSCFSDADSKLRYFSCESMYNVAKVAKGEILLHFNGLFDALSKVRVRLGATVCSS